MSKKIATYDDLLEEKARLQELLALQRETVSINFNLVKQEIKPILSGVSNAIITVSRMGKQPNQNPLVYFGIDLATQMVLRRWLKMKTGWVTRSVVPFVVRYYVSKLAAMKGNPLWDKVKDAFGKATS
ncbi:MAG: hypothetical protein JWP88_556 [Flaviaesturariibacter sp.]|nr:hypothetical protein [Flaviaesturariibacter sp.]